MSNIVEEIKNKIKEAKANDKNFTDLNLGGVEIGKFTPEINALIEDIKNLEVLYLNECGLTTLEGFPKVDLVAVDLSQNK